MKMGFGFCGLGNGTAGVIFEGFVGFVISLICRYPPPSPHFFFF